MNNSSHSEKPVKFNWVNNGRRLQLMLIDLILLLITSIGIIDFYPSSNNTFEISAVIIHILIMVVCVFVSRELFGVYKQIWRYAKPSAFMYLFVADFIGGMVYYAFSLLLSIDRISFIHALSVITFNLIMTVSVRLVYQYLYESAHTESEGSGLINKIVGLLRKSRLYDRTREDFNRKNRTKIKIAIVGAGHIGVLLADDLLSNIHSAYIPTCFVDIDKAKIGREIFGIPVISDTEATIDRLSLFGVNEIVLAIPDATSEKKKDLFDRYKAMGYKVKLYDYPVMQTAETSKRHLREFDIEDLLFRQPKSFIDDKTRDYYKNRTVLITGGGGSIGSELCRQIAKMQPKSLIILDIYENGAYDIQQELKITHGPALDVHVEIVSVCDLTELEKVFKRYNPDIVLHAAAHKHVPLMEHNVAEAVKNNVFGTLNTVTLSEKYRVKRFIMISTDKAVNPTNVMGATKRMCEMLVQSHSNTGSDTVYSATRFGNVLGSNGSVIPLFKRQIMNGGPITITDKRIIRYFMTIPEASQLVLQAGRLAKNGELFVLDMGKPIKILELAENMIRLSGYEPYSGIKIIETGLREGEKLYEELLIKPDELNKTENDLIFIERVKPLPLREVEAKIELLRDALETGNDKIIKSALEKAVPTFVNPNVINAEATKSEEFMLAKV